MILFRKRRDGTPVCTPLPVRPDPSAPHGFDQDPDYVPGRCRCGLTLAEHWTRIEVEAEAAPPRPARKADRWCSSGHEPVGWYGLPWCWFCGRKAAA